MKSLNATEGKITGTPKQLAGRIALNVNGESVVLQQPDISFLTRMGLAVAVGTEKKQTEGRGGKPSTIWQFDTKKIGFQIEQLARKQSPGKRAPKVVEEQEAAPKGKAAKATKNVTEAAPARRGRKPKAANDTATLANVIASAVVNALEAQKAA